MMKCEKVRPHLSGVDAGEPLGWKASRIREHLAGCSDCRKELEAVRKVRSLLALKRHEKTAEFFFNTFLSEFHRRLLSGMVHKPTFWARIQEAFSFGMEPGDMVLRLSYVVAVAVAVLSLYTAHLSVESTAPQHYPQQAARPSSRVVPVMVEVGSSMSQLALADNHADGNPVYVLDRVDYEPFTQGSVVLKF